MIICLTTYGQIITSYGNNSRNKYIGKEKDVKTAMNINFEGSLADHGVRKYEDYTGRFTTPEPLWEKYYSWSPYVYSANNPMSFLDPSGFSLFKFGKEDGSGDYAIDDGSNAIFELSGSGMYKNFEFTGYDETTMGGENNVNITTTVQESQILNSNNPKLERDSDGNTYCNIATQNIMKTIESIGFENVLATGTANSMNSRLKNSTSWEKVSKIEAMDNAQFGGLSLYSMVASGHGHIGSFSVGTNINIGKLANIGADNGFLNYNQVFKSTAKVDFFVLRIDGTYISK